MENKINKIYLCGFMGCGKSTLMKKWSAEAESHEFKDLDEIIFSKFARKGESDLGEVIERIGWPAFRDAERCVAEEISEIKNGLVLSLGGGFLSDANLNFLKNLENSAVVFLNTPFDVCFERIKNSKERPLAKKSRDELFELYQSRLENYEQAHVSLDEKEQQVSFKEFLNRFES